MKYSPEERGEALQLLAQVGKAEAARRTGIPAGTIASWGSRSGVAAPPAEQVAAAVAMKAATIADRKAKLAERLVDVAGVAVTELQSRVRRGDAETGEVLRIFTTIVDKMQLLTGEPTIRTENTEIQTPKQKAIAEARERAGRLRAV